MAFVVFCTLLLGLLQILDAGREVQGPAGWVHVISDKLESESGAINLDPKELDGVGLLLDDTDLQGDPDAYELEFGIVKRQVSDTSTGAIITDLLETTTTTTVKPTTTELPSTTESSITDAREYITGLKDLMKIEVGISGNVTTVAKGHTANEIWVALSVEDGTNKLVKVIINSDSQTESLGLDGSDTNPSHATLPNRTSTLTSPLTPSATQPPLSVTQPSTVSTLLPSPTMSESDINMMVSLGWSEEELMCNIYQICSTTTPNIMADEEYRCFMLQQCPLTTQPPQSQLAMSDRDRAEMSQLGWSEEEFMCSRYQICHTTTQPPPTEPTLSEFDINLAVELGWSEEEAMCHLYFICSSTTPSILADEEYRCLMFQQCPLTTQPPQSQLAMSDRDRAEMSQLGWSEEEFMCSRYQICHTTTQPPPTEPTLSEFDINLAVELGWSEEEAMCHLYFICSSTTPPPQSQRTMSYDDLSEMLSLGLSEEEYMCWSYQICPDQTQPPPLILSTTAPQPQLEHITIPDDFDNNGEELHSPPPGQVLQVKRQIDNSKDGMGEDDSTSSNAEFGSREVQGPSMSVKAESTKFQRKGTEGNLEKKRTNFGDAYELELGVVKRQVSDTTVDTVIAETETTEKPPTTNLYVIDEELSFPRLISSIDTYSGPSGANFIAAAEENCVRLLRLNSSAHLWNSTEQIGLCDESGFETGSSEETKLQAIKRIDVVVNDNVDATPVIFILCGDTEDQKGGIIRKDLGGESESIVCLTIDTDGNPRENYIADFAVDSTGDEIFILTSNFELYTMTGSCEFLMLLSESLSSQISPGNDLDSDGVIALSNNNENLVINTAGSAFYLADIEKAKIQARFQSNDWTLGVYMSEVCDRCEVIQIDQKVDKPGTILYTTVHGLYATTGSDTNLLYEEENIHFAQINGSHIAMTIPMKLCVKLLDIREGDSTIFAGGDCHGNPLQSMIQEGLPADGVRNDAHFTLPWAIILDIKDANRLFLTDVKTGRTVIRSIVIDTYNVTTFAVTHALGINIAQQPSTGDLYVRHDLGLLKVSYLDHSESEISHDEGNHEGFFTAISISKELVFLNERFLLLTDVSHNDIQVMDLVANTTISICSEESEPEMAGNNTSCPISSPKGITLMNGTIYITTRSEESVGIVTLTHHLQRTSPQPCGDANYSDAMCILEECVDDQAGVACNYSGLETRSLFFLQESSSELVLQGTGNSGSVIYSMEFQTEGGEVIESTTEMSTQDMVTQSDVTTVTTTTSDSSTQDSPETVTTTTLDPSTPESLEAVTTTTPDPSTLEFRPYDPVLSLYMSDVSNNEITCMDMKVGEPGTIMFASLGSLFSTNGSSTTILHDGEMFGKLTGFAQINGTHIAMTLTGVQCTKLLEIGAGNATFLAGDYCNGSIFSNEIDQADGVKHDARFSLLYAIILDIKDANRLILTDLHMTDISLAIRSIDIDTANVTTIESLPSIMGLNIVQQPSTGDFYIDHLLGLLKVSYIDQSTTDVSFESAAPSKSTWDMFTMFANTKGLVFLNDRTLLLTDVYNSVIQVVDLVENTTESICSGESEPETTGNFTHCWLSHPQGIFMADGRVYVTTTSKRSTDIMTFTLPLTATTVGDTGSTTEIGTHVTLTSPTQDAEEPVNQTTQDSTTQGSEDPSTQATEDPPTQVREDAVTQVTEEQVTQGTENPSTQATEDPSTQVTEDAVTQVTEDQVTQVTEDQVTQATEDPSTQATEDPSTQVTEDTVTQVTEDQVTQVTEDQVTQGTEGPSTQATEEIVTQATEAPSTQATEDPSTQVTEDAVTEVTEDQVTQVTEDQVTQGTEDLSTQATEETLTQATEDPSTQATEDPSTQVTEGTSNQATEEAVTQVTEDQLTQGTEGLSTQATEETLTQATEDPSTQATEDPSTQVTEGTSTQATEEAVTQATEEAVTQATEEAVTQATEDPSTQVTEDAVTQVTDDQLTQATEGPSTQATENPSTQVTENPSTQVTENAVTQVTEDQETQATEDPSTQATEDPSTQVTEDAVTQVTEDQVTQAIEDPSTQAKEDPSTQVTEDIVTQVTEDQVTQATEDPSTQATEDPSTQVTEDAVTQGTEDQVTQATEDLSTQVTEDAVTQVTEGQVTQATEDPSTQVTEHPVIQKTASTDNLETSTVPHSLVTVEEVFLIDWEPVGLDTEGDVTYTANGHVANEIYVATSIDGRIGRLVRYNGFPDLVKLNTTNELGMLPSYGSKVEGGYRPSDPLTFTHIFTFEAYMGIDGTAFIAVAEESCVRILFSNSSEELWNSTDPRYQRIGDCEKPGFASISANESLLQNIKKLVVARGNSSTADPIIYILCGDMTEKGGIIRKDLGAEGNITVCLDPDDITDGSSVQISDFSVGSDGSELFVFTSDFAVYTVGSQNSQISKISPSIGFAADVFSDAVIAVPEDNSFMIINVQGSAFYLVDIAAAKKQNEERVGTNGTMEMSAGTRSQNTSTDGDDIVIAPCEKHDINATICQLATCGGNTNQSNTTEHFLCSISDVEGSSLFFLDGTKELIFQGNGPNRTIMYSVHLEVETVDIGEEEESVEDILTTISAEASETSTVGHSLVTAEEVVLSDWEQVKLETQGDVTYTGNGHVANEIYVATSINGRIGRLVRYNGFPDLVEQNTTNELGMLPSYGSKVEGGYSPSDPLTFTHIFTFETYMGIDGTAFIAVAEESCVRILFSNSSEELWNSTDPRYQRIGDCEKSGSVKTSADESLLQNIQKIVVAGGNSSTADPMIYILYGDTVEKGGIIRKDLGAEGNITVCLDPEDFTDGSSVQITDFSVGSDGSELFFFTSDSAVYAIDSQNSQVSKISQSLGFAADVFSDAVIAVSEDNSFMIINVQGSAFYLVDIAAAKKQDGGRIGTNSTLKIGAATQNTSTGDDDFVFVPCDQHDVNATICVLATCPNQTITKDHFLCSISDVKSSSLFFLDGTNDLVFQGNGPNSTIMYSVHLEVETVVIKEEEESVEDILTPVSEETTEKSLVTVEEVVLSDWRPVKLDTLGDVTYTGNGHVANEVYVATSIDGRIGRLVRYNGFPDLVEQNTTNKLGMLPSYGSKVEGGYHPSDPLTFTHISTFEAYMGIDGTAFIAVAEESCVRILFSNSSEELWNSTDPRYQRIGDCEKSGLVNTSADESLLQNIQKIVVVRGNSSSADPIIYILYGDTAEKGGIIRKDLGAEGNITVCLDSDDITDGSSVHISDFSVGSDGNELFLFTSDSAVYTVDSQNSQVSKISPSLGFAADVFSDAVIVVSEDNSFMVINVQGSSFYLVDIAAAKKQNGAQNGTLAIGSATLSQNTSTGDEDFVFVPCEKHDVSATICVLAACGGQTSQTITTGHFLCSISDVKSSSMFFLEGTKELIFQGNGPNRTIMYSVHLEVETVVIKDEEKTGEKEPTRAETIIGNSEGSLAAPENGQESVAYNQTAMIIMTNIVSKLTDIVDRLTKMVDRLTTKLTDKEDPAETNNAFFPGSIDDDVNSDNESDEIDIVAMGTTEEFEAEKQIGGAAEIAGSYSLLSALMMFLCMVPLK